MEETMLSLTVNQCLIVMTFLVPFVIWLASQPISETINLTDKENSKSLTTKQQEHGYNDRYGAYIQQQGRYYN